MKFAWAACLAVILALALFILSAAPAQAQIISPSRGGTGTSTIPAYGQVLLGQPNGTYAPVATASLGITSGVSSVFGRTGPVTAQPGDYTTTQVTEGSNLYYTLARWAAALAGTTTDALAEGTNNLYFTPARDVFYSFRDRELKGMQGLLSRQQKCGAIRPEASVRDLAEQLVLFASASCVDWSDRPYPVEQLRRRLYSGYANLLAGAIARPRIAAV